MSIDPQPPHPAQVCVIGTGTMGVQIACLCALAGHTVGLVGRRDRALTEARQTIEGLLQRRVDKGKLTAEARKSVLDAISHVRHLPGAVAGADIVIESIAEDEDDRC